MAKVRTGISDPVSSTVLFAHDHTCCICRERGLAVQIHHIDEDPSNHDKANLAVLCLQCHDETQISGGFGRKYRAAEVTQYRDDWLTRVAARRDAADERAANKQAGVVPHDRTKVQVIDWEKPSDQALMIYIESLPNLLASAQKTVQPELDSGVTLRMNQGTYSVFEVVRQMLINLSRWFPPQHFGGHSADEYFSEYFAQRSYWHRALAEPDGPGTGGTIVSTITAGSLLGDAIDAVEEMVAALLWGNDTYNYDAWRSRWRNRAD